ncbi:MAG: response regulator [Pseudomonadota bacterium]
MENRRILVVDDDAGLRDLLQEYLSAQGYQVTAAADGRVMDGALAQQAADLIILDLMLPGEDGLSLARRLRTRSEVPIIMLSARGEDVDRIIGLEVGADDYLPKPFNPRELLARIRALLRRNEHHHDTSSPELRKLGPFTLNLDARTLHKQGVAVPLTAGEFNLLRIFAEHPNRVLGRDALMDMLKGYERSPFDRSIDVRVTRLRRKIEDDPNAPQFIRTVWGEGYLFAPGD